MLFNHTPSHHNLLHDVTHKNNHLFILLSTSTLTSRPSIATPVHSPTSPALSLRSPPISSKTQHLQSQVVPSYQLFPSTLSAQQEIHAMTVFNFDKGHDAEVNGSRWTREMKFMGRNVIDVLFPDRRFLPLSFNEEKNEADSP